MKTHTREKLCATCYLCQFDCVSSDDMSKCQNFKKGYAADEYAKLLSKNNVNLKRLCNKHNLKLNYMYDMLNNRIHLVYKYRVALDSALFERQEYEEYITKFEADGVVAYG